MNHLVVSREFEHNGQIFSRGMWVTDPELMADLLKHQPHSVLKGALHLGTDETAPAADDPAGEAPTRRRRAAA